MCRLSVDRLRQLGGGTGVVKDAAGNSTVPQARIGGKMRTMADAASVAGRVTERVGRKLAAVVSADVVGYSRLVERDEEGTVRRLKENWRTIVNPAVELHGGRVVKLMGDGALIEFPSVVEAVRFSLETQQALELAGSSVAPAERIRYRVGIHLGDVIIDGEDIQGHGVNVSARLESLSEPGGTCISDAVRAALGSTLGPLVYEDLGPQEVKNIAEPIRAYRIRVGAQGAKLRSFKRLVGSARAARLLAGVLAVLLVGVAAYFLMEHRPQQQTAEQTTRAQSVPDKRAAPPRSDLPSIAVLPFLNLSDDKDQEFFVDGLTEDLIADLSNISGLFVISRNSAFTYKAQAVRAPQVAADLGVSYVVNGSVRRSGDRVRITVELIDAATDRQIWADRFDRELIDVFVVEDEVKKEIVKALAIKLGPSEQRLVASTPTKNIEAYEYYLRGRSAMNSYTFRSLALAYWTFEKAIALDPTFAEAYASLAMTNAIDLTTALEFAYWVRPPQRTRADANALAEKAASLKPGLAVPELVFARLSLWDQQYDEAIEHARRAVEEESGNVDAYFTLALVLTAAGRHGEARKAIDEVFRRDPKPPATAYALLGAIQFSLRDYKNAIANLETYSNGMGEGGSWLYPAFLFAAYGEAGMTDKAQAGIEPGWWSLKDWDLAWTGFRVFYRHPEDMEHLLDGLRKAGAPALPWGFEPKAAVRAQLSGPATAALLFGQSFDAMCSSRKMIWHFAADGAATWTWSDFLSDSGVGRIEGDKLCLAFPIMTRNREACGTVYRNADIPNIKQARGYDYILVGPAECFFSPRK